MPVETQTAYRMRCNGCGKSFADILKKIIFRATARELIREAEACGWQMGKTAMNTHCPRCKRRH